MFALPDFSARVRSKRNWFEWWRGPARTRIDRLPTLSMNRTPRHWIRAPFWLVAVAAMAGTAAASDPDEVALQRGEAIYLQTCQNCHGEHGQGVEEQYADPLTGDLTISGLAELIADTMPEEHPASCVGDDAKAVATFVHQAFYSEAARVRNRPPRAALARLTGEQLRQSLADLYGHFGGETWVDNKRGVQASYFDANRWDKNKLRIERVDPVIDFDFGEASPGEGIDAQEFYVLWSGSLKVDISGRYEIVLRSSLSCMMKFGGDDRELVNNHVQSEGKEEFRRTLFLTAGREYPFSLEFIQRKRKTKQPPAKVSLSWVPPGGIEEVVPTRHLIPAKMPATFSLQAKLPPDDRSYGYERGTAVHAQWDDSTTEAAVELAEIAASELYPRYRHRQRGESDENRAKLRGFLNELVRTAFRGPLDEETRKRYIDHQLELADDDSEAIKRSLLISLKSPRFLYPLIDADRSHSQRVANRLTLFLFDSLPADQWMLDQIGKDQLSDEESVRQAAWKMVSDYRCRAKIRAFLHQWFDLVEVEELVKDQEAFPDFDATLVGDLKASFDAFLDAVVWGEGSDFRELLQADWGYTTERLAAFYGSSWEAAAEAGTNDAPGLLRSVSDPRVHVGALTHPLLVSHLAYHRTSSPIHRGVFLTRHTLGRVLRPPNAAFTPLNPDLHPDLTTRQRVELQTGEVSCQVCHEKINSLGFALEEFDAAGRFRALEKERPIDPSGSYVTRAGATTEFNGARQLGDFLASSEDCHRAFVESAFEQFVKQPIASYGPDLSDRLTQSFQESGFHIQQLIVSIAMIACEPPPPPPPLPAT